MKIKDNTKVLEKIKQTLQITEDCDFKFNRLLKNRLANDVYKLKIDNKTYILKKYNYDYNFSLSDELYEIYEKNKIKIVKPINKEVINIEGVNYNIFKYLTNNDGIINDNFIIKIITIDRHINYKSNLISKCDLYQNYLSKIKNYKINETIQVLNEYNILKKYNLFNDNYINHGDLSKGNILFHDNNPYIIDFDETTITTELYDFAVIAVKLKTKGNSFKYEEIRNIIKRLDLKYTKDEYKACIKMYLCKILLEKFYLYEKGKIDLFDSNQIKDNYMKYFILLKDVNKI